MKSASLVDTYAETVQNHMVLHHLDSFNQYVHENIPTLIKQLNPFNVTTTDNKYTIEAFVGGEDASKVYLKRPMHDHKHLTPAMARELMTSYMFRVSADVLLRFTTRGQVIEKWYERVHVASIPIMLRSDMCVLAGKTPEQLVQMGECPYDFGGYFIIDGKEKVIVSQEKLADHKMVTIWDDRPASPWMLRIAMRTTAKTDRFFPKNHMFFVRKSSHGSLPHALYVSAKNVQQIDDGAYVPIVLMFRALGVERDADIMRYVTDAPDGMTEAVMRSCFADHQRIWTQADALQHLATLTETGTVEQAMLGLLLDFMPHAGTDLADKAAMLGRVVRDIVELLVSKKQIDRDSLASKRVQVSGALMTYITRDFYNQWRLNAIGALKQEYEYGAWKATGDVRRMVNDANVKHIFKSDLIDSSIMANFKSNKRWAIRRDATEQEAIVQDLKRIAHIGTLSHLRRVHTPLNDSNKSVQPRRLHCTHYGMVCPHETPDGGNIGRLKHLSMLAFVTFNCGMEVVHRVLSEDCGMVSLTAMGSDMTMVFIDNVWVGGVPHAESVDIANYLRLLRRAGDINCMISISHDIAGRRMNLGTEAGRYARPLLVVTEGQVAWDGKAEDWWSLVTPRGVEGLYDTETYTSHGERAFENQGVLAELRRKACPIEYVDVDESITDTYVALYHRDITKRHTHCEIHPMTMLGWTVANLPLAHHNAAPRVLNAGGQSKQCIGVFATTFRKRYDVESYVMTHPQRPLITTTAARHCFSLDLPHGQNLIIAIMPFQGYNEEDGILVNRSSIDRGLMSITAYHTVFAAEDSKKGETFYDPSKNPAKLSENALDYSGVSADGVIRVGERVTDRTVLVAMKSSADADHSVSADKTIGGIVDKTAVRLDKGTKERNASVCVRDFRFLTIGDKLASRFYNKSIVGMMVEDNEMPFVADGIVPDAIINPHSFPTRMTMGQLVELAASRLCCAKGGRFSVRPLDDVYSDLLDKTLEEYAGGTFVSYDPCSGMQMQENVHFGVNYMIRMKQQVADKMNFRNYGPIDNIIFQPLQGRGNDGGLRIGEMEVAALASHGVFGFLNEAMQQKSDGNITRYDDDGTMPAQTTRTRNVLCSRAFEVTKHETLSMLGIEMRIGTDAL